MDEVKAGEPRLDLGREFPEEEPCREHYAVFRGYVTHEDDLINQRIHWLLLVSSFMFASLAVIISQAHTLTDMSLFAQSRLPVPLLSVAVVAIALSGLSFAMVSEGGILAAARAQEQLSEAWKNAKALYPHHWDRYPHILGGGSDAAHLDGLAYPAHILLLLKLVWSAILVVGVVDWALRYLLP